MSESSSAMPDAFDRLLGALDGLPDVTKTKPSTIRTMPILGIGGSSLYIVQTVRQQIAKTNKKGEEVNVSRDTVFLEVVSADGAIRVVLPPEVADTIARHRDSLGTKVRSKSARRVASERKERGEVPGFLRGRKAAGE